MEHAVHYRGKRWVERAHQKGVRQCNDLSRPCWFYFRSRRLCRRCARKFSMALWWHGHRSERRRHTESSGQSVQPGDRRSSRSDHRCRRPLHDRKRCRRNLRHSDLRRRLPPVTTTGVTATINTVTRVDVQMELGSQTQEVTVSGSAAQLQTDKSDVHTELNPREMANLPLPNYRNFQSLINLVPGATPAQFTNSITDTPSARSRQT